MGCGEGTGKKCFVKDHTHTYTQLSKFSQHPLVPPWMHVVWAASDSAGKEPGQPDSDGQSTARPASKPPAQVTQEQGVGGRGG